MKKDQQNKEKRKPYRIRLPGFLMDDEDLGLGDAIKRATYAVGVRPCGGCEQRATAMNGWVVFSRSGPVRPQK
jgi:hypothetical protein